MANFCMQQQQLMSFEDVRLQLIECSSVAPWRRKNKSNCPASKLNELFNRHYCFLLQFHLDRMLKLKESFSHSSLSDQMFRPEPRCSQLGPFASFWPIFGNIHGTTVPKTNFKEALQFHRNFLTFRLSCDPERSNPFPTNCSGLHKTSAKEFRNIRQRTPRFSIKQSSFS